MGEVEETIHAENICALVLAILNPWPMSAEMAFEKLANPGMKRRVDHIGMALLRKAGCTWKEIGELMEMNHPQSAYCHARKRKETQNGKIQKR